MINEQQINAHSNEMVINSNHSFTELFFLFRKYRSDSSIDYAPDEMQKMLLHSDNAITTLLQGLQSIGNLIRMSSPSDKEDIMHLGQFLVHICNLLEALYILRLDAEGC